MLDDLRNGRVPTRELWTHSPTTSRKGRGRIDGSARGDADGTLVPWSNGFRAELDGEVVEHRFGPEPHRTTLWRGAEHVGTWWHTAPLDDEAWARGAVPTFWHPEPVVPDGAMWPAEPGEDSLHIDGDQLRWRRADGTEADLVLPLFEERHRGLRPRKT